MTYMKMLYDKQEGCFTVLDNKRYAIVDMNNPTGIIYVNHYKDGTMYTGTSPFVNAECSCIETFSRHENEMQRLGLINFNSEYLILYSTKKVSKLKRVFESIAKHGHIDNIEVACHGYSSVKFDDIDSVMTYIQSVSTKNRNYQRYSQDRKSVV